jgi:hypothetical protein
MPDSSTLKCSECGHENEPERVYCHNCGAKLDRTLLPKPEEKKNFETPDETRRRVSKMMNPRPNWAARDLKALIKMLILSALVAALVLYWLPPENAPQAGKDKEMGDYMMRDTWSNQMTAAAATSVEYKEEDINRFLKTLKGEEGFVKFKGASVECTPGVLTVLVEREIWGLSMWSSVDYHPTSKDGKFVAEVVGVHYGRLGVDPSLTFAQGWGVDAVTTALAKDFKPDRVQSVTVEEGKLTIVTKP